MLFFSVRIHRLIGLSVVVPSNGANDRVFFHDPIIDAAIIPRFLETELEGVFSSNFTAFAMGKVVRDVCFEEIKELPKRYTVCMNPTRIGLDDVEVPLFPTGKEQLPDVRSLR